MATSFVIPTYFTAVDKFSAPVRGMSTTLESFGAKAEIGIARGERAFRKLTPALGEASKQMLSMVGTAAIVGAAFAGGAFSVRSIMEYENELANLQAVTGASGKDFDIFKGKIKDVATETKASSVEVVKAFTAIANNQPELLKDADALAMVTKSSILLAQAAKIELQPAGEALTQILNQFGKGAGDAAKTIDILAAGSVAGSSEIRDTADAIQKFGTVAANAGIKINESVALIELASKFEKGSEAGQKLRNILITMSTAKVQDPKAVEDMKRLGVNMDIVSNKSLPLNDRLKEMAKVSKDDAALFHIFGKENQALATGVLSTASNFDTMLKSVNTTGMAASMAEKNNATLSKSIDRLSNAWVTMITTSDSASSGLIFFTKAVSWLTRNLDTVVTFMAVALGLFGAWWAIMKVARVALILYNIAFGVHNALTKGSIFLTEGNIVAKYADLVVTNLMTAAQWALNAAMTANPIALVVLAVLALVAALGYVIANYKSIEELHSSDLQKKKTAAIKDETEQINKAALAYEKYGNTQFEAKKKAIRDSKEFILADLTKQKEAFEKPMTESQRRVAENQIAIDEGRLTAVNQAETALLNSPEQSKLLNPKAMQTEHLAQTINNNSKKEVTVDFKNVPQGVEISGEGVNSSLAPTVSSTMK